MAEFAANNCALQLLHCRRHADPALTHFNGGTSVLEQAVRGVARKVRIERYFPHIEAGAQIPDASLNRAKIDHVPSRRRNQFVCPPGGIRPAVALGACSIYLSPVVEVRSEGHRRSSPDASGSRRFSCPCDYAGGARPVALDRALPMVGAHLASTCGDDPSRRSHLVPTIYPIEPISDRFLGVSIFR